MFTGLIQSLGTVRECKPDGHGGAVLTILEPAIAGTLVLGESVAVNGVCLSVVEFTPTEFRFQVGPETLARTVLGKLQAQDRVNLERSLRVGDSMGGHFVTGHIDCVGTIANRELSGEWENVVFAFPESFSDLMVDKGSIAVDGISLTVVKAEQGRFSVMLIPHTRAHTTLGFKSVGDGVNLEFDLLAKHVRKLVKGI